MMLMYQFIGLIYQFSLQYRKAVCNKWHEDKTSKICSNISYIFWKRPLDYSEKVNVAG